MTKTSILGIYNNFNWDDIKNSISILENKASIYGGSRHMKKFRYNWSEILNTHLHFRSDGYEDLKVEIPDQCYEHLN